MHHKATITRTTKTRPFHGQCICGTAGDFLQVGEASAFLQGHIDKQGGISTGEIIDNSADLEAEPVLPKPHVDGVGDMPASHAALGVEKEPTPPESRKGVNLTGEQAHEEPKQVQGKGNPPPPPDPPDAPKKKKE